MTKGVKKMQKNSKFFPLAIQFFVSSFVLLTPLTVNTSLTKGVHSFSSGIKHTGRELMAVKILFVFR